MTECQRIDLLFTPYVDGDIDPAEAGAVDRHLQLCGACRDRVRAERAARLLVRARQSALSVPASEALRARCASLASREPLAPPAPLRSGAGLWRARLVPFALAASLVVIVGAAFLYELTAHSTRIMAAELTADHMKCFRVINPVLGTHHDAPSVERSMASSFDWPVQLPAHPERAGLELVGARPCLYAQGRVAHIMYRHHGHPVSVFMLPRSARGDEVVEVLGHQAAVWSVGNRTFVLVTNEPPAEAERMTSFVHAALQ